MSVKTCKCSHLKSEHHKGLCENCPCTFFTNNIRSKKLDNFFKYLALVMTIILLVSPIMFYHSWSNIDPEIGDQIVRNTEGLSISYSHILLMVMGIISLTCLCVATMFYDIYNQSNKILNRKDYS